MAKGALAVHVQGSSQLMHMLVQVTEVLDCMVPSNCRLDLQSSAFGELKEKEALLTNSGAVSSTEPW